MEYGPSFFRENLSWPDALKSEVKFDDLCPHRVKDGRLSHQTLSKAIVFSVYRMKSRDKRKKMFSFLLQIVPSLNKQDFGTPSKSDSAMALCHFIS
jgi:hypothetical protein